MGSSAGHPAVSADGRNADWRSPMVPSEAPLRCRHRRTHHLSAVVKVVTAETCLHDDVHAVSVFSEERKSTCQEEQLRIVADTARLP